MEPDLIRSFMIHVVVIGGSVGEREGGGEEGEEEEEDIKVT